jgi:NAD(P)-dependent dehydrogenase (short-subunit alcohol dehydrogenase family)
MTPAPGGRAVAPLLDGRVVLVTGAGDGVGRGIALACASAGASVVVTSRGDNGTQVVAEISRRGGSAVWARCDVDNRPTVETAIGVAADRFGGLDALVHNATSPRSSQPHRLEEVTPELLDEHSAVSLRGAYHCATLALPLLRARQGTLIVMGSPAGVEGSTGLPLYSTMKGALRGFGKSLAREWAPLGVTVNVVSPLSYSPALARAIAADPPMQDRLSRRIPMARIGDPEHDIGAAVALLLSPAARYVTGQTIGIDGGHFTNL